MPNQVPKSGTLSGKIAAFPGKGTEAEERTVTKSIVIIMPFGGSNPDAMRQYQLQYKRLKHLIERHIVVWSNKLNANVRYNVNVAMARATEIRRHAFDMIANAEVVIALLTEKNVNVIYELAIRNLIKPAFLMIVKGEPKDVLPIYLHNMEYIRYEEERDIDSQMIQKVIDRLAADWNVQLTWGKDVPEALANAVDEHDGRLNKEIVTRLEVIESSPPTWPEFLRQLGQDQHPGKAFESWICYNPTSVVKISWRKKASGLAYDPADRIGEPVVCSINEPFAKLYDFVYKAFPDPDGPNAATAAVLLKNVAEFVDEEHLRLFKEDQTRVADRLIFKDSDGQAQVPLQFNHRHPTLPGKVFLPCMLAKRTMGDPGRPHTTYLVVSYIEDFWPIDHSDSPFSGLGR